MSRSASTAWLIFFAVASLWPSSATAKSWFFVSIRGQAPARVNTYGDKDSIRKGAEGLVHATLYDVFETPRDGASERLYTVVVDCDSKAERHLSTIDYGSKGEKLREQGVSELHSKVADSGFKRMTSVIVNFACNPGFYKEKVSSQLATDAKANLQVLDDNAAEEVKAPQSESLPH